MATHEKPKDDSQVVMSSAKPNFEQVSGKVHDGLGRIANAADTLAKQQKGGASGGARPGLFADNASKNAPKFDELCDSIRGAQQQVAAHLEQRAQPTLGMGSTMSAADTRAPDGDADAPDATKGSAG